MSVPEDNRVTKREVVQLFHLTSIDGYFERLFNVHDNSSFLLHLSFFLQNADDLEKCGTREFFSSGALATGGKLKCRTRGEGKIDD